MVGALWISGLAFLIGAFCAKLWGPPVNEYSWLYVAGAGSIVLGTVPTIIPWVIDTCRRRPRGARLVRTMPRTPDKRLESLLGIARNAEGVLDLRDTNILDVLRTRGHSLRSLAKLKIPIEDAVFGDRDWEKPPGELSNLSFEKCLLRDVIFLNTHLTGVYFRGCKLVGCDFRYAFITGTSFQDATLEDCDFYRTYFSAANIFTAATLHRVSLDKAWLDGITGLTADVFKQHSDAMVQEAGEVGYEKFLRVRSKLDHRPPQHSVQRALEEAPFDAAQVYRGLSGIWTAQGQLGDAGFAYVRCKTLERTFHSPWTTYQVNRKRVDRNSKRAELRKQKEDGVKPLSKEDEELVKSDEEPALDYNLAKFASWVWLWIAGMVAKFGESWGRVAACIFALDLVPGTIYSLSGGVERAADAKPVRNIFECWLFSFEQLTSSSGHFVSTNSVVDLIGSIQTVLGLVLLGLFGFALANRIRNA
jgi:hypothetical protein